EADLLRRELAGALDRLAEGLAGAGDVAGAIGHARRRLALDRLQEPAHRRLMRLYAQGGDRAAAVEQYRVCVRTLRRELGVGALLAGAGAPVVAARCFADEAVLPYASIASALRALAASPAGAERIARLSDGVVAECARLVPEIAAGRPTASPVPMEGPGARLRLLDGIAAALLAPGSAPAPVVVVDDLHNADEASLEAVAFIVRRLRGRPALVMLTFRGEE